MKRTFAATTHVAASPERVWAVLADVLHWPEWLPTVTSVEPLGPAHLAVGARYRITQPKLRPAIWSVVGLEPSRCFSWESHSRGVRAVGDHCLSPVADGSTPHGSTEFTLQVHFSGSLSVLAGVLAGPLTREYLARETAALRQRVEDGA